MKKAQLPLIAELDLSDTENSTSDGGGGFAGTSNPRRLRVIFALMVRPRKREEIDRIAGASNGPELIASLRRRNVTIPCRRVPGIDRDGNYVTYGVYEFTDNDRRKVLSWLAKLKGRKHG